MTDKKTIAKGQGWELYFSYDDDDFHLDVSSKLALRKFVRYAGRKLDQNGDNRRFR